MADSARDIVFISYRRSDARHPAGRIHEKLEDAVVDRAEVYMDVDSIAPGKNFRTHLEQAIVRTRVMIVVIGSTWLTASKGDSVWWRTFLPWLKPPRRLDDPNDYVRHEIRSALPRRRITILPALVDGARMPEPSELPDDIRALCDFQAVSLRHEQFREDARALVKAVIEALAEPEPPPPALTPEPAAPPPAAAEEKPSPQPVKAEPAPAATPAPAPPGRSATPAASPPRQPEPSKTAGTLAEERRKLLANLEHLHAAAVTRDPAARKTAHLQYVSTLNAAYAKESGNDAFVRACRSAVTELDAWRQDNALLSRVRYWVPVFGGSYTLVIWLVIHSDFFHGLEGFLMTNIAPIISGILLWAGGLIGKVIPLVATDLAPWLVSLLPFVGWVAAGLGTLVAAFYGGAMLAVPLGMGFEALAGKWRIPHCDAALARARSQFDAPPAVARK